LKPRFLGDEAALGDASYACYLVRSASPSILGWRCRSYKIARNGGNADLTREQAMGLKPRRKAGVRLIYLDALAKCVECLTHEHDALLTIAESLV
jgi:hypothetical protein